METIPDIAALDLPMRENGSPDAGDRSARALPPRPASAVLREEPLPGPDATGHLEDVVRVHARFFRTGRRDPGHESGRHGIPAILYPYLDPARVRGPYPVCLFDDEKGGTARPLAAVVDALIAREDVEGEAYELRRHDLLRLEGLLRAIVEEEQEGRLGALWARAEAALEAGTPRSKRAGLRSRLEAVRSGIDADALVIGCTPALPARLFRMAAYRTERERTGGLRDEIDALVAGLEDILAVDASQAQGHDVRHLEASAGADAAGIDFGALADLLGDVHIANPLPERRRRRIQSILDTLHAHRRRIFTGRYADGEHATAGDAAPETVSLSYGATALGQLHAVRRDLVAFFRAAHMARLEVDNRYREEWYDAYFAHYGWADLTDEEAALCPPLYVHLDSRHLERADRDLLVELLGHRLPVKILVTVDRLCDASGPADGEVARSNRGARLAAIGMALGHAYVQQTAASNLEVLLDGFVEGLKTPGPALFCVYTGDSTGMPHLAPYLRAAVAHDARAFPAFRYNPEQGADWAAAFRLDANPDVDRPWPVSEVACTAAGEAEASLRLPFTFADFLACDVRFREHLLPVPRANWHPQMMAVAEYLAADAALRADRIPYVTLADDDGVRYRAVVTRTIVRAAGQTAAFWRRLQDLGGVDSSHVRAWREREQIRIEAEKQAAVEAVTRTYEAELQKTTDALAREIVSNIAAGLLQMPASNGAAPVTAPARLAVDPVTPRAEAAAAQPEPAPGTAPPDVEDDEPLTLDEAYVETPRCTSCNECTNLNGRLFAYNEERQAYIKDVTAGTYRDLVTAAERCPVHIIHPGKPRDPDEPGLDEWLKRAEPFL